MTVVRMQCSWALDTVFPRDRVVINPHFEMTGALQDADALAEDLATQLQAWSGKGAELTVKSYDAEGTPPVFPNGEAIRDAGQAPASTCPRELAVCLSFYAERNLPRQRGRLYCPVPIYFTGTVLGNRPTGALRTKPAALVPIFAALGGVDVDWVVWSKRDGVARKVTNWWVDDEWDVQRSRGLRSTTRDQGTTSG